MDIIKESTEKFTSLKVNGSVRQVVEMAWNFDLMKSVMREMLLDETKLPMGKLQKEQILKAFKILKEI